MMLYCKHSWQLVSTGDQDGQYIFVIHEDVLLLNFYKEGSYLPLHTIYIYIYIYVYIYIYIYMRIKAGLVVKCLPGLNPRAAT